MPRRPMDEEPSAPGSDRHAEETRPASPWCRCMGELALYRDALAREPVMKAGKPLALLAYVALAPGGRVERSRAARLFWSDSAPQDARHSLSQALYRLRAATKGPELLRTPGDDLEISESVRLDCLEAERAAEAGELRRSYDLLAGEFIASFTLPGSWEFEEWAEAQRSRFGSLRATVGCRLAGKLLREGCPDRALDVAESLARFDPYSDDAMRLVMEALAAAGRHAAAASRYAAYVRRLAEDGDEPGAGLRHYASELTRYLRTRRLEDQGELPFVGREKQWAVVESAWQDAEGGDSETMLVEGAAGLGKTRMLTELRRRVQASRGVVLFAKCYEPEQSVPYGAVGQALSGVLDRSGLHRVGRQWLSETARILPGLHDVFQDLPPSSSTEGSEASRRRLHESVAHVLETVAEDGPILLAVDDIHWADAATLELLHFLSHRLRSAAVLIAVSYRPAELAPISRRYTRSLASSGLARIVVMEALEADDVREILESMGRLDEPALADTLVRHLHRQSGGSPFFLSELLDALARRRVLFLKRGSWIVDSDDAIDQLPQTIGKMLTDRLESLAPWMRACAEVAAVAEDELSVEVLSRTLGISQARAELALSVLEEERLVRRTSNDSFDLIHDELRRLIQQNIPDERRRVHHGSIGLALEALGEAKRPGGLARLVYHFDRADDAVRARRYALSAAEAASALSAPDAARIHLDMAAAHAPRALPPSQRSTAGHGSPDTVPGIPWQTRWILGLVVVGAIVTGLLLGPLPALLPTSSTPSLADARQGVLYIGATRNGVATHRLVWPDRMGLPADIQPLDGHPADLPPPLLNVWVDDGDETHLKIGVVEGGDTLLLTSGRTDDTSAGWSPDGTTVLLSRGWRTDEARFVTAVFTLNPETGNLRQISRTRFQDQNPEWSPLGTRIAFRRDSLHAHTLWLVDSDGERLENLSGRFDLPTSPFIHAFDPGGRRLALGFQQPSPEPNAIHVVDLDQSVARTRTVLSGRRVADIAWSPDGRWLAYVTRRQMEYEIWAVAVDGGDAPQLLARLAQGAPSSIVAWNGGTRRYVDSVHVRTDRDVVPAGHGILFTAEVWDASGAALDVPLRWTSLDQHIVRVDTSGFVIGREPGTTAIVASAGGYRSDTTHLTVSRKPVDTLLIENWSEGIATRRWRSFGQPEPRTLVPPGEDRPVFSSNGDYNHASGVISRERFDPRRGGLTIETEAHLPFTGSPWQIWQLGVVSGDPDLLAGVELVRMDAAISVQGPEPVTPDTSWTCGPEPLEARPELEVGDPWIGIAVQVRPDGVVECHVDDVLLGRAELDPLPAELSVVLRGHTVGTNIYHGSVVVTRGLRR